MKQKYDFILQSTLSLSYTNIIGHYNPTVRITADLLIQHEWCWVNDDFQWQIFHFMLIYSRSFCQKSAENKSPKKYFFFLYIIFHFDAWPGLRTRVLCLIKQTHCLTDNGDFKSIYRIISRFLWLWLDM